jgi:tripartite-type tricarboxylate transporter receptor subunit TctC
MRLGKFSLLLSVSLVMSSFFTPTGYAQDFPNKPIKIIAPFPPGGATDLFARAFSDGFLRAWGQPVIVENKPGASGIIGAEYASRQPGDGYTMVIGAASLHSILPLLNERMGEVQKSLVPISQVGVNPSYVVVPASLPVNTIGELITYLKANPGKFGYGSAGAGTSQHVFVELFKQRAGIDMFQVPYKGSGPMVIDLIAGRVVMVIEQGPAVLSHIKAGKLKALAVTTPRRSVALPDVPTLAESALPGFEASTWFAVYAPAGTPRDVVMKLNAEINKTLALPDIRNRLLGAGVEPEGSTPEALGERQKRDIAKWAEVVKTANIRLE